MQVFLLMNNISLHYCYFVVCSMMFFWPCCDFAHPRFQRSHTSRLRIYVTISDLVTAVTKNICTVYLPHTAESRFTLYLLADIARWIAVFTSLLRNCQQSRGFYNMSVVARLAVRTQTYCVRMYALPLVDISGSSYGHYRQVHSFSNKRLYRRCKWVKSFTFTWACLWTFVVCNLSSQW